MTKEGVCPKESKQKDHSPRTTGKYARRRQKFYIYSWTPFKWCLRTRAHLIGVCPSGVEGGKGGVEGGKGGVEGVSERVRLSFYF